MNTPPQKCKEHTRTKLRTEEYPVIGEFGGKRIYCPKCEREKLEK